jgi:hypothetical protein
MKKLLLTMSTIILPGMAAAQSAPPVEREDIDNTRFGGTSAVFLTLPADARGAALGGSYASLVDDIAASFYNPAAVAFIGRSQAMLSVTSYVADTRHIAGAMGWSLRGGDWGLSVSIANFGFTNAPVYTEDAQDGNEETYSVSNTAIGITIARQFSDRFAAGITPRLVTEQLGRASGTGFTVDLGTSYRGEVAGRPLRASFTLVNYGTSLVHDGPVLNTSVDPVDEGMEVEDTPAELRTSSFEPPTQFRIGMAFDALAGSNSRLTLLSEFFQPNDSDPGLGFGAEFGAAPMTGLSVALRGSFTFAGDNRDSDVSDGFGQSAFGSDMSRASLDGLALGGGLNWRSGEFSMGVDYAYRHLGFMPSVNMFSVKVGW